jgi:hypothetical protein
MAPNFTQVGYRQAMTELGLICGFVVQSWHGREVRQVGSGHAKLVPEGQWCIACKLYCLHFPKDYMVDAFHMPVLS